MDDKFEIKIDNQFLILKVSESFDNLEVLLKMGKYEVELYINLLNHIIDYLKSSKLKIRDGETIEFGMWILKFVNGNNISFEIFELNAIADEYVPGAELAIKIWKEQSLICNKFQTEYLPPKISQKIVISDGIYEGDAVQGVRYHSPSHMSGWWLTTDRYDGNIKSLKTIHIYHIVEKRPDLVGYLALPFGFRFDFSEYEDVWFDEKVFDDK